MEKLYEEEFADRVLKSDAPVVVDFYADWCGPCKMLSPVLESLEDECDDYLFYKINIDENEDLARQYQVMTIPNVVVFKNGEAVARSIGLKTAAEMKEFLLQNA